MLSKCLMVLRTSLSWLDDLSMGVMTFTWSFMEARKITNVVCILKEVIHGWVLPEAKLPLRTLSICRVVFLLDALKKVKKEKKGRKSLENRKMRITQNKNSQLQLQYRRMS